MVLFCFGPFERPTWPNEVWATQVVACSSRLLTSHCTIHCTIHQCNNESWRLSKRPVRHWMPSRTLSLQLSFPVTILYSILAECISVFVFVCCVYNGQWTYYFPMWFCSIPKFAVYYVHLLTQSSLYTWIPSSFSLLLLVKFCHPFFPPSFLMILPVYHLYRWRWWLSMSFRKSW